MYFGNDNVSIGIYILLELLADTTTWLASLARVSGDCEAPQPKSPCNRSD